MSASAATLAAVSTKGFAASSRQRVFVASGTPEGIRSFDWDDAKGELTSVGVAADESTVDWLCLSPDQRYLFAACEVDSFNGKPTGEVASFRVDNGNLVRISTQNSASKGTCHCALDRTGRVLLSADYGGGSAASFKVTDGKLSPLVWSENYTAHGPNPDRQEAAHAHFASFSPNNRFAYINDLGGDVIHIYTFDSRTAVLKNAGAYHAAPGAGPRTLHFHPNDTTAYCMNELNSTVDILKWNKKNGSLTFVNRIELLPANAGSGNTGCDTVISRDGSYVYFANRGDDFIFSFTADPKTGALTPIERTGCGGKTPRNFTLDPTERWMLVADQNSSNLAVFSRDASSGKLASDGKTASCPTPTCIAFVGLWGPPMDIKAVPA